MRASEQMRFGQVCRAAREMVVGSSRHEAYMEVMKYFSPLDLRREGNTPLGLAEGFFASPSHPRLRFYGHCDLTARFLFLGPFMFRNQVCFRVLPLLVDRSVAPLTSNVRYTRMINTCCIGDLVPGNLTPRVLGNRQSAETPPLPTVCSILPCRAGARSPTPSDSSRRVCASLDCTYLTIPLRSSTSRLWSSWRPHCSRAAPFHVTTLAVGNDIGLVGYHTYRYVASAFTLIPRSKVRMLAIGLSEKEGKLATELLPSALHDGWFKGLCIEFSRFDGFFRGMMDSVCRVPADKSLTALVLSAGFSNVEALGRVARSLSDPRATHRLRSIRLEMSHPLLRCPDQASPMQLLTPSQPHAAAHHPFASIPLCLYVLGAKHCRTGCEPCAGGVPSPPHAVWRSAPARAAAVHEYSRGP